MKSRSTVFKGLTFCYLDVVMKPKYLVTKLINWRTGKESVAHLVSLDATLVNLAFPRMLSMLVS